MMASSLLPNDDQVLLRIASFCSAPSLLLVACTSSQLRALLTSRSTLVGRVWANSVQSHIGFVPSLSNGWLSCVRPYILQSLFLSSVHSSLKVVGAGLWPIVRPYIVRQVDFRIVQHVMRPLLVKNDIAATTMMHVAAHEQVYQRLKSEVFSKYAPHDADSRMPYEEDIVVLRRAVYLLSAWGHSEDPDAHCAKIDALIQEHVDSIRRLYPESFSVHNSAPPTGMIARLQLSQLMEYMRERFHGNEESYYDSRNSYLLSVLQRGLGIPISLAMLMIVLGHSLGMSEFIMLNSPGHFLMRYTNPHVQDCDFIVDAFRGILVEIPPEGQEAALSILPCKSRKAFVRMISNLVNTFAPADGSGFLMPSDLPASMESYVDSWREVDMREKFVSLLRLAILAVPKPARPYFVSEALKSLEMLKLAIEYRETMSEHVPPRESAAHYNSINLISKWLSLPTVSRWMAKVRDIASAHGLADVWSDVVRPSIFTGAPLDEVNVHV